MVAIAAAVVGGLLALGGLVLGGWFTARQQREQRRAQFLEHQLRDFYSPLLSLLDEILAKTRMREKIMQVARDDPRVRGDEFTRLIQHDNEQFVQEIFPHYQSMLKIFRDNRWLAEPETRGYFATLVEFVEIWDRWLMKTISAEVVARVGHSEEPLHPFYEHLRRKHDELQAKLSQGKV